MTTSNLRVLVTAAGTRALKHWNNHLDRRKHFIQIPPGGETLIQRTVRLLREFGVQDIVLVAPERDLPNWKYEVEGATTYRKSVAKKEENVFHRQADRYLPRSLWNKEGRTLFVPGDFYFTHATLKGMIDYDPGTWVFYARLSRTKWPRGHELALSRTRMILGLSFPAHEHDLMMKAIEEVTAMQRDPESPVNRSLGLDIYRHLGGQTPEQVAEYGRRQKSGLWPNYAPHLWEPPVESADVDFDKVETYGGFMLHYQPALHG